MQFVKQFVHEMQALKVTKLIPALTIHNCMRYTPRVPTKSAYNPFGGGRNQFFEQQNVFKKLAVLRKRKIKGDFDQAISFLEYVINCSR